MAELTVMELLASQPERKLRRMHDGILAEIDRLQTELRQVDEALTLKRSRLGHGGAAASPVAADKNHTGRFEGLPREELLAHVARVGRPVSAPEMRGILEAKGIVRRTEAVRTGLARLVQRHELIRTEDGKFAVPDQNGNSLDTENEAGLSSQTVLGEAGR